MLWSFMIRKAHMPVIETSHAKILLVEDDAFTRFKMQEIAQSVGIQVETAVDGAEGAAIFKKRPQEFDLILMDLHMPVMSGIDATSAIREIGDDANKSVPIVAVTSDAHYHNIDVVQELGMNGFARKPMDEGVLREIVSQYCDNAHLH